MSVNRHINQYKPQAKNKMWRNYTTLFKIEPSPFARFIMILMALTKALAKAYIKSPKFGVFNVCKSIIFSYDFNLYCAIAT